MVGVLSDAAAQSRSDPDDNFLRAAYCVGVLRQTIDVELGKREKDFPTSQSCQSEYAAYGFSSAENCLSARSFMTDAMAEQRKELQQKLKRYVDYVKVRVFNQDNNFPPSLIAVVAKGKSDAAAVPSAVPRTKRCLEKCLASFQCLVDCVAEHDQISANVLRCQLLPDGLPF